MADENLESVTSVEGDNSAMAADAPASQPSNTEQSHYVSQSQVNDIVKAARSKAFEKGQQDATQNVSSELEALKAEFAQLTQERKSKSANASEKKADSNFDPAQMDQLVEQKVNSRLQKEQDEWHQKQLVQEWQKTVNDLQPKVKAAAEKYNDFDEVTGPADFLNTEREVLYWANTVDNSGDMLYHLAQNPAKLATLKTVMRETPNLVGTEIQKLSSGLKQNESADNMRFPPEPLSQIQTSNIGGNNGPNTVSDFKKIYTV